MLGFRRYGEPMKAIARFFSDHSGATAIEYGLLSVLIGAVIVAAVRLLGSNVSSMFTSVSTNLT
jgi:pilus assembly protein Flp/PilA